MNKILIYGLFLLALVFAVSAIAPVINTVQTNTTTIFRGQEYTTACFGSDDVIANNSLTVNMSYKINNGDYIEFEQILFDAGTQSWINVSKIGLADNTLGVYDFQCNITDVGDDNLTTSSTSNDILRVLNNKPIVFSVNSFAVNEDFAQFSLNLANNRTDVEDSSFNWGVTGTNSSLITIDNSGETFTFTSVANQSGNVNLNFTVNDSENDGTSFVTVLTVNAVNDNPWNGSLSNPSAVNEDSGVNDNIVNTTQLNNAFLDVEQNNAPTTYSIQSQSNTTAISCALDGSNNMDCTTQANHSGSNLVTVRMNDSGNLFTDIFFTISINAVNDVPFGYLFTSPANNTGFNQSLVSFAWNAGSDVENSALTYELQIDNNNNFSSLEYSNTTTMTSVNANLSDGTYFSRLRAGDGVGNGGFTDIRTIRIDATAPKITLEEIVSTSLKNLTLAVNTSESSNCYARQTTGNFSTMTTINNLRHTKLVELVTGDYTYEFRCWDGFSNSTKQMSFSVIDSGTPSNTKKEDLVLTANVSQTITVSSKLNISITTSSGTTGSITVAEYTSNPLSDEDGLDSNIIGNFISINAGDDIKNSLTSNIISLSYEDGNFDESTIQIYRYNTGLGVWKNLANITRDAENNIVTGVSDSFSTYVVSASDKPIASSGSGGGSSSGGVVGGQRVYVQKDEGICVKIKKYVLNDYLKQGYVLCDDKYNPLVNGTTLPTAEINYPSKDNTTEVVTPTRPCIEIEDLTECLEREDCVWKNEGYCITWTSDENTLPEEKKSNAPLIISLVLILAVIVVLIIYYAVKDKKKEK